MLWKSTLLALMASNAIAFNDTSGGSSTPDATGANGGSSTGNPPTSGGSSTGNPPTSGGSSTGNPPTITGGSTTGNPPSSGTNGGSTNNPTISNGVQSTTDPGNQTTQGAGVTNVELISAISQLTFPLAGFNATTTAADLMGNSQFKTDVKAALLAGMQAVVGTLTLNDIKIIKFILASRRRLSEKRRLTDTGVTVEYSVTMDTAQKTQADQAIANGATAAGDSVVAAFKNTLTTALTNNPTFGTVGADAGFSTTVATALTSISTTMSTVFPSFTITKHATADCSDAATATVPATATAAGATADNTCEQLGSGQYYGVTACGTTMMRVGSGTGTNCLGNTNDYPHEYCHNIGSGVFVKYDCVPPASTSSAAAAGISVSALLAAIFFF